MSDLTTRLALPEDADGIAAMLASLAQDLGDGDAFSTTPDTIHRFGFGPTAMFQSVIAEMDARPVGLALFFPHFSTTRALPGVYVQDLWVAPDLRGVSIGQHLLAEVARHGLAGWQASYIALSVHADNSRASQFYHRLGFAPYVADQPMALTGAAFQTLLHGGAGGQ